MFLTTFDKKMYEEAIREEGREMERQRTEAAEARANEATTRANEAEALLAAKELEITRLLEENARLKKQQTVIK